MSSSRSNSGSATGGAYGLAVLGAMVYYVQNADSFLNGAWGVIKAFFWPGFLIYELMDHLNM